MHINVNKLKFILVFIIRIVHEVDRETKQITRKLLWQSLCTAT